MLLFVKQLPVFFPAGYRDDTRGPRFRRRRVRAVSGSERQEGERRQATQDPLGNGDDTAGARGPDGDARDSEERTAEKTAEHELKFPPAGMVVTVVRSGCFRCLRSVRSMAE